MHTAADLKGYALCRRPLFHYAGYRIQDNRLAGRLAGWLAARVGPESTVQGKLKVSVRFGGPNPVSSIADPG